MLRRMSSLLIMVLLAGPFALPAATQKAPASSSASGMTEEQEAAFLLNAKVISSKRESKGVTSPYRLTLSDGQVTHEASFQPIDERRPQMQFADGSIEINFKDSYRYNIAGYQLAKLLGLDNMVPVYVERKWRNMRGSMSWRIDDVAMDAGDRMAKHIEAPDPVAWNGQMYKIRVFDELIYNTDPNLTNVLVTKDWSVWLIDFTRAFRLHKDLKDPKNLVKCDRNLLQHLKELDAGQVLAATKDELSKGEVKALMARRDKIVQFFDKEIASKGESAVLY
jgi:hypothetical protein